MDYIEKKFVVDTAIKINGGNDFFGDDYHQPLQKLLTSINTEASLSRNGRRRALMQFVDILNKRSKINFLVKKNPHIKDIPINKPIFIIGLPRTGTTLLHNLMAQNSSSRTFKLWELSQPISLEDFASDFESDLIAKTNLRIQTFGRMHPKFASIHPLEARACDECNWLLQNTFASNIFSLHYFTPAYFDWLMNTDLTAQYEFYKLQLQAILWREKQVKDNTTYNSFVFKSPDHLWHLIPLFKVFPNARVIQLHRKITECVPSFCSLCLTLQQTFSDFQTAKEIGKFCLDILIVGINRMLDARSKIEKNNFIDISYAELVKNPRKTLEEIYEKLEISVEQNLSGKIEDWLVENRQHKTGKHEYNLAEFGLTEGAITEKFKSYTAKFESFM